MQKEEDQNSTIIHLENQVIKLIFGKLDDNLDVDELTKIQYHNLYGDAVTISTLLNKVGILKAEVEAAYDQSKLDLSIYESDLKRQFREQAAQHSGKFQITAPTGKEWLKLTEKSIEDGVILDAGWQQMKMQMIQRKKEYNNMASLYKATDSKDKKLSIFQRGVVPEDFEREIIEEKINGMFITKHNKKYS